MCSLFRNEPRRWLALLPALVLAACSGAQSSSQAPAAPGAPHDVALSTSFPGGGSAPPPDPAGKLYDGNPQAIAEGKRLFGWYNCVGCHFNGAGGIGPALMDATWIYGDSIDQIYSSIAHGRPNGMPSWQGKLSPEQIWQLAAYVRSLPVPSPVNAGKSTPQPPPPVRIPAGNPAGPANTGGTP
jgi:cytochrome c oxidase cbb3-type subunit 3